MTEPDVVRLTVPAMPEFLRLVRVTAAGLGSRLGFSFDQVDDLRLAIDELIFGLTGAEGREGSVQVTFQMVRDTLEVSAVGHFEDDVPISPESPWSKVILAALVDDHELASGPSGPWFHLVKRRRPLPPIPPAPPRPPASAPS